MTLAVSLSQEESVMHLSRLQPSKLVVLAFAIPVAIVAVRIATLVVPEVLKSVVMEVVKTVGSH